LGKKSTKFETLPPGGGRAYSFEEPFPDKKHGGGGKGFSTFKSGRNCKKKGGKDFHHLRMVRTNNQKKRTAVKGKGKRSCKKKN